jgi:ATP-dependent Clp protease protease subunit
MRISKEFQKYAISEGISSSALDYHKKRVESSMTPMILEERELRATMMTVFDRLMMDRLLWVAGPVNDSMSTVVQAQLMFLDNIETKDIVLLSSRKHENRWVFVELIFFISGFDNHCTIEMNFNCSFF